jgi:hypothetical protein
MDNNLSNSAIFVESRDLMTYLVNVTCVPGIGLVMKCKKEIGFFSETMKREELEYPLIISTRGNKSATNCFVRIEGGISHYEYVVGITNFPFQAKPATFRALPSPMKVIIVPAGTRMEKIPTNSKATARAAFQAIEERINTQKGSAIIAEGNNMLVQGWEIFLPAENSDMPYFPEECRKDIFSIPNMVNAALRSHANRLDEDPVGGEGKHFIILNQVLADEAVGDSTWKDKLLPVYTRKLAGNNAEVIVSRLVQKMREDGWSLTINTDVKTLPLQAISPNGIIVASGQCLGNIRDRGYWKEIIVKLCDGLGFDTQKQLLSQISLQKAAA